MHEQSDEKVVEENPAEQQPREAWHQRHFPQLLAVGMLLLIVLLMVFQSLASR